MDQTDEALMLRVRDGDVAKLGVLFERHHAALFQFFRRMTGNRPAAEDLVQDVFFRILKYRRTFRDDSRFTAWMFHIARNARHDYFNKRPQTVSEPETSLERAGASIVPHEQMECEADSALLEQALSELREDKRELLVLARYQELKYSEIAELLGVDIGTVKVRVHRAVKELRDIFLRLSGRQEPCSVKNSATSLRTI